VTEHTQGSIWVMIAVIGVGTFLIRVSFLAVLGRVERVPPLVERILRLIPAAVLAALIVPSLTHPQGDFDPTTVRMAAGLLAGVTAWKTRNVLATMVVGMGSLWILQALV
jgi:branched-subunit amino acid transport protein